MEIIKSLGCFKVNGVIDVFQGVKFNITAQLMLKHVLYVFGVHCMAHHINLAIQTLSGLSLVSKIKSLFYSMHNFLHIILNDMLNKLSLLNFLSARATRF
jgi:hypothetical protein